MHYENDGCMLEVRSPARRIQFLDNEMAALQLRINAMIQLNDEPEELTEIGLSDGAGDIVHDDFNEPTD